MLISKGKKIFHIDFAEKKVSTSYVFSPYLISELVDKIESREIKLKLFQVFYQSLMLRKLVSYSVRIVNITTNEIDEMERIGKSLFKACCLFDARVSPSMWVFSNVAAAHCKDLYNKVGMGLGLNTMEGREQKHQLIDKYAQNTTYQDRWKSIFRHEFIQLIYLRENGFDSRKYVSRPMKYVPEIPEGHCPNCCSFKLENGKCVLCDSPYFIEIVSKVV